MGSVFFVVVAVSLHVMQNVAGQPEVQNNYPNSCSRTESFGSTSFQQPLTKNIVSGGCLQMPDDLETHLRAAQASDPSWNVVTVNDGDFREFFQFRAPESSFPFQFRFCILWSLSAPICSDLSGPFTQSWLENFNLIFSGFTFDCNTFFCTWILDTKRSFCGRCSSGWAMTSSCTRETNRACTKCGPGTYAKGNRCAICPVGTSSDDSANANCPTCRAELGLFQNETGQTGCKTCSTTVCSITESLIPCSNTVDSFCLECPDSEDATIAFKPYPVGMDSPTLIRRSPSSSSRQSCEAECQEQVNCAGYILGSGGTCIALLDWPFDRGLRSDGNLDGLFFNRSTDMAFQVIFRKAIAEDEHVGILDCQANPCVGGNAVANSCVAFGVCVCKVGFLGKQCEHVADTVTASSGQNCEALVQEITSTSCPCGLEADPEDSTVCIQEGNSTVSKRFARAEDILNCLDFYRDTLVLDPFANIDDVPFRSLGHGTACLQDGMNAELDAEAENPAECSSKASNGLRSAFQWNFDPPGCLIASAGVINTFPNYSSTSDSTCFVSGFKIASPGSRSAVVTHLSARVLALEAAECVDPDDSSGMFFDVVNSSTLSLKRVLLDNDVGKALMGTGNNEDLTRNHAFLIRADLMTMIDSPSSFCGIPCKCGSFAVDSTDLACSGRIETITEVFEHARAELRCIEESGWNATLEDLSFLVNSLNCLVENVGLDDTGQIPGNLLLEASRVVEYVERSAAEEATSLIPIEILWKSHLVDLSHRRSFRGPIVTPADQTVREPRIVMSRIETFAETLEIIENVIPKNEVQYKLILQIAALSSVRIIEAFTQVRGSLQTLNYLQSIEAALKPLEQAVINLQNPSDEFADELSDFIINFVNVRNPNLERQRMNLIIGFLKSALSMTHAVAEAATKLALEMILGKATITDSSRVSFKADKFGNALLALEQLLASSALRDSAVTAVREFQQVRADLSAIDSNLAIQSTIADLGETYISVRNLIEDLAFDCITTTIQLLVAVAQLEPGRINVLPWLKRQNSRRESWRTVPALSFPLLVTQLQICPLPEYIFATRDDEGESNGNETTSTRILLEQRQGFRLNSEVSGMRRVLQLKSEGHGVLENSCTSFSTRFQDAAVRANEVLQGLRVASRNAQRVFSLALNRASREADNDWVDRFEAIDEKFRSDLGIGVADEPTDVLNQKLSQFVEAIVRERSIFIEQTLREHVDNLCESERFTNPTDFPYGMCNFTSTSIYGNPYDIARTDPNDVHTLRISFDQDQAVNVCPLRLCEVRLIRKSGVPISLHTVDQEHHKFSAFRAIDGDANTCNTAAKDFEAQFRVEDIHQIDRVELRRKLPDWVDEVKIELDGVIVGRSNCGINSENIVQDCPPVLIDFSEPAIFKSPFPFSFKVNKILETLTQRLPITLHSPLDSIADQMAVQCSLNELTPRSNEFWASVSFESFERRKCLGNERLSSVMAVLFDSAGHIIPQPGQGSAVLQVALPNPGLVYKYAPSSTGRWQESSFEVIGSDLFTFEISYRTINRGESCSEVAAREVTVENFGNVTVCFSGLRRLQDASQNLLASPYAIWNVRVISTPAESAQVFRVDLRFNVVGELVNTACSDPIDFSSDDLSVGANPILAAFSSNCVKDPVVAPVETEKGNNDNVGRALGISIPLILLATIAAVAIHRRRQTLLQAEANRNSKVIVKEDVESEEVHLRYDL